LKIKAEIKANKVKAIVQSHPCGLERLFYIILMPFHEW